MTYVILMAEVIIACFALVIAMLEDNKRARVKAGFLAFVVLNIVFGFIAVIEFWVL